MKFENDKFIIYYNGCDEFYINQLIDVITNRMPKIISFFKINFQGKIVIKLYNNINEYKSNLEASFYKEALEESKLLKKEIAPRKFYDWMIANTEDGNINMQSFELVKSKKDYENYSIDEFCLNAAHEFTHLCQQQVGSNNPGWFWESLATNLGNLECNSEIKEPFTLEDLSNFDLIDGYGAAYSIGKYLFSNYSNEEILEMVKDNSKLFEVIPIVISKINEKLNKRV